jgi:hypothetical protein
MTHMAVLMITATALASITASDPVMADMLSRKEIAAGLVTACSTNGHHACYTARLVRGPMGPKLRLKGGTLMDCEGDCRDALRRATVDFWDDQRERNSGN